MSLKKPAVSNICNASSYVSPSLSFQSLSLTKLAIIFPHIYLNSHFSVHQPQQSRRSLKIVDAKFSFFQSVQDPALPPAEKCPSVSHSHPSRGCVYHLRCLQETQAVSPHYKRSRYPRKMNLLPRHLLSLPAMTLVPAQTRL